METSQARKRGVPTIFDPKKPWLWILLAAILCAVAAVVCLLILPKKNSEPVHADADTAVFKWLDYQDSFGELPWEETKELTLDAFPGVTFRWTSGAVEAVENGKTRTLFTGMPVTNVFVTDVTGDGRPDFCASVYFGSGIVDEHIVVYDYANLQSYTLWDRMRFDYHLYVADGELLVGRTPYMGDKQVDAGTLVMRDGILSCRWQSDGSYLPLDRQLNGSELIGEWLVQEETDNDGNVLYTFALDNLWKEYHFREDGTVVYNETVPISSDSELAFGHPVAYTYTVHNNIVYVDIDDASDFFRWGSYDRETNTLHLTYNTPDGSVDATLTRMDEGSSEVMQTLDSSLLENTWALTEIIASDGRSSDPMVIQFETYLDFSFDTFGWGSGDRVHIITRNGENYTDETYPFTVSGNTVTIEGKYGNIVLKYNAEGGTLRKEESDPDDIAVWVFSRMQEAALPYTEARFVGRWEIESMDLDDDEIDVTSSETYQQYRDLKIELYRSGEAVILRDGQIRETGYRWIADGDDDGVSDFALVILADDAKTGYTFSYDDATGTIHIDANKLFPNAELQLYLTLKRDPTYPLSSVTIAVTP